MELREKLFIFDTGLDDRVIEYLKLVFSAYYYDQDPEAQFDKMLLFVTEDGTKELEYLQDGQGVAHVVVDDTIYEETVPILEEKGLLFGWDVSYLIPFFCITAGMHVLLPPSRMPHIFRVTIRSHDMGNQSRRKSLRPNCQHSTGREPLHHSPAWPDRFH